MSDSVGSVSVEVVPDARGWTERLRAQIRDATVTVNVNADTTEANAQIDEAARNRDSTINVGVNKSQISEGTSALDGLLSKITLLPALAVGAGAALVPLTAAVGGLVAAIGAPLAIAGGGAGLFGIAAAFQVKRTEEQMKAVAKAQTALTNAVPGPAKVAALKAYHQALAGLTPDQKKFSDAQGALGSAFQKLADKTDVLAPLTAGMKLLAQVLPLLAPVLKSVGGAFSTLLGDLSKSADSPGLKRFLDQFAGQSGRDLVLFGKTLGNLALGFSGLFAALDSKKLSGGVLNGLLQLSQNFAHLGQGAKGSQWLKDFIDYFHRVGPQVASTVGAVAQAVGHLVRALAPLGPPVLHIIKGIADAISSIPTGTLTALLAVGAGVSVAGVAASKTRGAIGFVKSAFGAGGVQKVFVTNPGFGEGGGPGGKPGVVGTLGAYGAAAAVLYGAFKLQQAKGQQEDAQWQKYGATTLVGYAEARLDAWMKSHLSYTPQAMHTATVGPFSIPVPTASRSLTSNTNAFDALRAHAQSASRDIDQIGPHAVATFATADRAVNAFEAKLAQIHDQKFRVIADTASAISSLERLQAFRIQNKSFTVYQRSQLADRAVGPGGGQGQSNPGGGSGGGASGRTQVHVHLDDSGRHTLSGYMDQSADRVYRANRSYENAQAGR